VRTFRHQLILGLAISDFFMAVNFLSSCAVNLSGHSIGAPSSKKFCSFNGFMTQFFVVQSTSYHSQQHTSADKLQRIIGSSSSPSAPFSS
jgi:hypothetical protein